MARAFVVLESDAVPFRDFVNKRLLLTSELKRERMDKETKEATQDKQATSLAAVDCFVRAE